MFGAVKHHLSAPDILAADLTAFVFIATGNMPHFSEKTDRSAILVEPDLSLSLHTISQYHEHSLKPDAFWLSTARSIAAGVHSCFFRKYADTLISSPDICFVVLLFMA